MNYKDKLLKQIEDAREWLVDYANKPLGEINKEEREMFVYNFLITDKKEEKRLVSVLKNKPLMEDLEEYDFDAWIVAQILGCLDNNRKFRDMNLNDGSPSEFEKSKAKFREKVEYIQQFTSEPIEVSFPERPREKLLIVMEELEAAGHELEAQYVFAVVMKHTYTKYKTRRPKHTDYIDKHDKAMQEKFKKLRAALAASLNK